MVMGDFRLGEALRGRRAGSGKGGMNRLPTGWRLWLLVTLTIFCPILFHPWWLLILSTTAYALLVWLLMPRRKDPK
jgi:hypothetical protein